VQGQTGVLQRQQEWAAALPYCHVVPTLRLLLWAAPAGRLPPVYWLPDPSFYGAGALERLRNFLAVVPVIMTA
jgi:hypothetical protein